MTFRPHPTHPDCPHCNLTAQVMRFLADQWIAAGIDRVGE